VQAHSGVHQRPAAEGCYAVTKLAAGDHSTGHSGAHGQQLLLGETDGQRQQSGAAESGQCEGTMPAAGFPAGSTPMTTNTIASTKGTT
jgi:hypothetical protein